MNRLKLVAKGFENYTGNFGPIPFVDGVSVDPVPDFFARRVSAATATVWIDADGKEIEDASVAHRLVADANMRAPILEESPRQSENDKKSEQRKKILKSISADEVVVMNRTELEAVVQKDGVKALRVIGDKWGVKHKQALALIDLILEQQSKWIEARNARLAAAGALETPKEEGDGVDDSGSVAADGAAVAPADGAEAPAVEPAAEGAVPAEAEGSAAEPAEGADEGESQSQPKAE